jgi:enoyl-CoA hydratase/carnithine racemase
MGNSMSANAGNDAFFSLEVSDHVAELVLAKPETRNCIGPAFWRDLPLMLDALRRNSDVRARLGVGPGLVARNQGAIAHKTIFFQA